MRCARILPVLVLVAWPACGGGGGGRPPDPFELGDPNPGLTAQELAAFDRGRAVFEHRFARSEGHGPHFNVSSCRSCHEIPVTGGSASLYRNFFFVAQSKPGGGMQPLLEGNQFVLRLFSYERAVREAMPAAADIVAQRNAPPTFGLGHLERIPGVDIVANADPFDLDADGISGVPNFDGTDVGRFGYKAQESGIEDFVRGPIFNHMGITTNPLVAPLVGIPQVGAPGTPTTDDDGVPDPELPSEDLADLVHFMRQIAPPRPLPGDAESTRGEALFRAVGCAKCHIENIVRSGEPVRAYTDLLLHDMGPALADGIQQGDATGSEFRTQPLWGVRHHAPFLHDGRAATLDDAVLAHGGEATQVRDAFAALAGADRAAVLRFLETR